MTPARAVVNVDDDRVRVTTWTFDAAGAATGEHRHEFDYLVVPVTGGTFKVIDAGSEREMNQWPARPTAAPREPSTTSSTRPTGRPSS